MVSEPQADWSVLYARIAACGVYVMALVAGFAMGVREDQGIRVLATFGFAWSLTFFCALDARAHQKVFVNSFWLFTFLGWPLVPLFHLWRTRGKKGVLIYFLHAFLLSFCALTSGGLGTLVR